MQEADRDGFNAVGPQLLCRPTNVSLVEGRDDLALVSGALRDLKSAAAWNQRLIGRDEDVVHGGSYVLVAPSDLDHISKVPGGNHSGLCAVLLDEGVGRQCGSMNEEADLCDKSVNRELMGGGSLREGSHQPD